MELLGGLALFRRLSGAQLRRLAGAVEFDDFEPHQVLVREAQRPPEEAHILLSGLARLVGAASGGRRFTAAIVSRGPLFHLTALRPELECRFSWEAMSRGRSGAIGLERLVAIVGGGELAAVLGALYGRAASLFGRYPGFASLDLRRRVALALLELGEEVGARDARGQLLRVAVPARVMGEMTGASRPKVSMVLTEFERQGLIVRDQRRIVILTDKLQALLKSRQ
jgi:CRP-like cAMP-binding protein